MADAEKKDKELKDAEEATKLDAATEERYKVMKEEGLLHNRKCTDFPCILVAAIMVMLWIILLSVAASLGKPERIIMPSNFRGDLCGDKEPLLYHETLWIPRASRLSYGLCVQRCPTVGDIVCNNDIEPKYNSNTTPPEEVPNHYYSMTTVEQNAGRAAVYACTFTPADCTELQRNQSDRYLGMLQRQRQYKCFTAWYASGSTLFRCLPFQDERDNVTLATLVGDSTSALQDLADFVGVGSFFNRGFGEVQQSWLVILLSALTACFLSLLWIFLLRCLMKPIIYFCILLIFALLILVGYLAMLMADDLENVQLPGDTATSDQVKLWRALQYGAWILAAMYLVVMIYLFKRIKIAIAIMREASYAFLESPGLVVVPPIVFLLFCGWVAFFIVTSVYIQTIGDLKDGQFTETARDLYGDTIVNASLSAANASENALIANNVTNQTVNTTEWTQDEKVKIMHAYNFFMFLWASTFCIMTGFYVIAMVGSSYYFSADQGQQQLHADGKTEEEGAKPKQTDYFAIPRSLCNALTYNLGTVLFGSLLIAIIQFVRFMFMYLKEQFLEEWKETQTIKCILCYVDYCLAYIAKVIEIISKNAFIVNICLNTWFCESAGTAVGLLITNAARVGVLATLSTVAMFVLKVFIVGCNMIIAWAFINTEALTMDKQVESGLFPMFGILIMSFIIASIFMNVYESLVDTTLLAFLIDEDKFGGNFMPEELAELTDMFKGAEMARIEYEKRIREATEHNEAKKADTK